VRAAGSAARPTLLGRFALVAAAVAGIMVACGARSELFVGEGPHDATTDVRDAPAGDGPLVEGGPLDVQVECATPSYCVQGDPGHVYKCGVPIFQCSSLEQCEEREDGALCVNPCVDSLGNDTSNGCEFYAVEMDTTQEVMGVCYAVFVVNQWKTGEPAKIQVDLAGQVMPIDQFARIPVGQGTGITYAPYDPSKGLPTNQIAILFLSRDPNAASDPIPTDPRVLADCPAGVTPAVQGDASLHGTGTASAFHIKTNVPVVAYQILPYGGGRARVTGSTLLVPTNAWSDDYVVADAYQAPTSFTEDRAGPTTVIIATQDGTNVTVKPTADILAGGGLAGTPAFVPVTYPLSAGQYLQVTQNTELTGTAVQADKPIAVIGASTLMDLPLDRLRADSAEQMLPPVRALGSEYVAARFRSRDTVTPEAVPWRIVGVVDGTMLTYDPYTPAGAPAFIDAQQLAEFDDPGPFVVRSQDADHPFYVASYMTGGEPYDGTGDPEFINVVPPAQYLPRYTFFTDPTYPETNLVVVRQRDAMSGAMPDVTLDCAGVLSGWTPVDGADKYEMTRVDLSTGDYMGVGGCDNGVHTITGSFAGPEGGPAPTPAFGVTVWGWGSGITWQPDDEANPKFTRWVSYGYPAGANFKPVNSAVLSAH
jgi:hypothetical protein